MTGLLAGTGGGCCRNLRVLCLILVLDIARMIALSRDTMGNIRQNITVALGLKAVFLVTTIIGITGLWPAILADTGATVLVTANAMRLLGAGSRT